MTYLGVHCVHVKRTRRARESLRSLSCIKNFVLCFWLHAPLEIPPRHREIAIWQTHADFREAHCRKSISFHGEPRDKNYYSSPELTFEQTLLILLWLKLQTSHERLRAAYARNWAQDKTFCLKRNTQYVCVYTYKNLFGEFFFCQMSCSLWLR